MKLKLLIALLMIGPLSGCAKPFQPPPAEFSLWKKTGVSEEQVKHKMLSCGFPDIDGFVGNYTHEAAAAAEQCMIRDGFRRRGSWKGVCSLASSASLKACQGAPQPINR